MSLSDMNNLLLISITTYGALALALVFFFAALGVPLPSTLCLVAGGAFIEQGMLEPHTTLILALVGVLMGDTLSYAMGRVLRKPLVGRYGQSATWQRAADYFAQHAALGIYLTRVILTPIAVPINLIAGSSAYPVRRFVEYAFVGELTWLLGYGTLGYLFGSQWQYVNDIASNFSGLIVGLLAMGAGCYALIRLRSRLAPASNLAAVLTLRHRHTD